MFYHFIFPDHISATVHKTDVAASTMGPLPRGLQCDKKNRRFYIMFYNARSLTIASE